MKMIISVILMMCCCAGTFANYQENYLMKNLWNYFDDNDLELIIEKDGESSGILLEPAKREAAVNEDASKNSKLQMDATNEKVRSNHYWTRKRGRDTTNNWWNYYETSYNVRPTSFGNPNSIYYSRGKRNIFGNLLNNMRAKRQTEEEEKPSGTEDAEPFEGVSDSKTEDMKKNRGRDNQKVGGNFRRSM